MSLIPKMNENHLFSFNITRFLNLTSKIRYVHPDICYSQKQS